MALEISEGSFAQLEAYSRMSIAFEVRSVIDISQPTDMSHGYQLRERLISIPYVKDYDAIPGNHPTAWPARFDTANWGLLMAKSDGVLVGGAIIACDTDGCEILDGRSDLAVLWDLRVAPDARGTGVGSTLFRAVESWAGRHGCSQIKVETQNTNAPACDFYRRMGCTLRIVMPHAYPELPDEVQLLWYKDLAVAQG